MSSSPIVTGYNYFAKALQFGYKFVPESVAGTLTYFSDQLKADGFKTFIVKPLALVNPYLKFTNQLGNYPRMEAISRDASAMKAWISAFEVLTKLPSTLRTLSSPIEESKPRLSRVYSKTDGKHGNLPQLSHVELVFKRGFTLANWLIACADTVALGVDYGFVKPQSMFDKATPLAYTFLGGYMGAQALYEGRKFVKWLNQDANNAVDAEKWYGYFNLFTSAVYFFVSAVGGAGLYYKNQVAKPSWLGYCQFAATVSMSLLPAVYTTVTDYMEKHYWTPARP